MNLKTIPRELINLNLKAARLPVDTFQRVTRRGQDAAEWSVAIAIDSAEATVRETLGGLLGDSQLLDDARLQRAKVAQMRKAIEEKAAAARTEVQSEARYEQRKAAVEQQKDHVEQQANQREQQLEREKAQAKQRIAAEAARKQEAADKAAKARQDRIAADERAAELRRLNAESAALAEKERALAAADKVAQLDAAAKATKRARKAN